MTNTSITWGAALVRFAVAARSQPLAPAQAATGHDYRRYVLGLAAGPDAIYATVFDADITSNLKDNALIDPHPGVLVALDRASLAPLGQQTVGYRPRSVAVHPLAGQIAVTAYGRGQQLLAQDGMASRHLWLFKNIAH